MSKDKITVDPFGKSELVSIAADTLLRFLALQDQFDNKQSEALAEYLKVTERSGLTNAEKHFLLAARSFVLDYPAELKNND